MDLFAQRRFLWFSATITAAILVLLFAIRPYLAGATASDPVVAAWEQARAAGSYHFVSDILQVSVPSTRITNVGRSSRSEQLYLAGQADLRAATLEMQLWSQSGSVLQDSSALSVRVEKGKTFVRRGAGEWQESNDLSSAVAPQGDFMAYLAAVRNVTVGAAETRAGITFIRYRFQIDGPTFAAYVRDQIEAAMRQKGELPPEVHIDLPVYYRDMTGSGELWVRQGSTEHGFPLRQILDLHFPEQGDETVNARITVDFTNFGAATTIGGLASEHSRFFAKLAGYLPSLTPLFALLPMLALAVLILYFRGRRSLERALALVVIASLVVSPLLHTFQLTTFLDAQHAKAATQEEIKKENDMQRTLRELDASNPEFNPQADPLASGGQRLETGDRRVEAAPDGGFSNPQASPPTDDGTDTDQDGLTDFIEVRIGTSPTSSDSDEDLLSDQQEVNGFDYANRHWHSNPLKDDSNGDSMPDTLEWDNNNDGQPDDTDGDGAPDLFDNDNDGDGVLDSKDLSPFTSSSLQTPFSENNPFQLTLNNLQAGVPTFVDFQLRPQDPNHLWFAFNVLDWPQDSQGQVQDVDQKTFADLASAEGRTANATEANGDLQLIPMLEIRIDGATTNLPSQADLTPYNITINNLTADGSTQLLYVPLSIITDEASGQRVAFSGRMRYLPSGSWPAPHTMRLVWAVQSLIDIPCDPQAAVGTPGAAQGCAADGYIHNVSQVIQSYYDQWTLAGLNVSEDHGSRTAVIYEDPDVDANRQEDSSLWLLARGLDNSFLAGRDQDGNGQRDVDLNEIVRRFDHASNSSVSETERWAIPNVLRVEEHSYPTFDQAVMATTMTETLRVLNNKFNAVWSNDKTLQPLLLYTSESSSRALGLDAAKSGNGSMTLNGSALIVDLQPVPQTVMASLKWIPYCNGGPLGAATPLWAACDVEAAWAKIEQQQSATGPLPGDPNAPIVSAGRLMVTLLYNLALTQGFTRIVQSGPRVVSSRYSLMTDTKLETTVRDDLAIGNAVIKTVANKVIMAAFYGNTTLVEPLGKLYETIKDIAAGKVTRTILNTIDDVNDLIGKLKTTLRENKAYIGIGAGVAVAAVIGLSALIHFLPKNKLGLKIATKILINAALAGLSIGLPAKEVYDSMKFLMAGGYTRSAALAEILGDRSEFIGSSRAASVIGTVIAIGITWGFFLYSMIANHVSAFSPEFNRALAEAIATTIYLIVLAVISSTVIGTLLVALIAVIDAVLTAICELGVKTLRKVPGLGGACFTLGTAAIKVIAKVLYAFDVMVDTSRQDLAVLGQPDIQLSDPSRGFVADNPLTVSLPVTTTIVHKNPDLTNWQIAFYLWLFSKDNLRSTTFKYTVTRPDAQEVKVKRDQMKGEWQNVQEDHKFLGSKSMYRGYAYSPNSPLTGVTLEPGLNRELPFYLNMGYALPAYECWTIPNLIPPWTPPLIPVCYTRTVDGHNSTRINAVKFDIFPSTLASFMTLADKGNGGLGLAWDPAFRSLADADGDGLLSSVRGGLDPNDARWDSDGDSLSDAFELERRQMGVALSPSLVDTDNDGLTDAQEMQFNTDPASADSDNDGLKDGEEIWHQHYDPVTGAPTHTWEGGWDVTVVGATTVVVNVSSNPNAADSDSDGISDQAERQLALDPDPTHRLDDQNRPYHPLIYNTPPLAIYPSISDPDGFVGMDQTFVYTATVVAHVPMAPGVVDVTRSAFQFNPAESQTLQLAFDPLTFSTAQTVTAQTSFQFHPVGLSSSVPVNINSTVRTHLTDNNGGLLIVSADSTVILDIDGVFLKLLSPPNGSYVQGAQGTPKTLIIGGDAKDFTSGVANVEISVNDSPYAPATGTESWAFPLQVTEGSYRVIARGTDLAGNPGSGSGTFIADATPPQVTLDPIPVAPSVPVRNADGLWSVTLSGTVQDPAIGDKPGSGVDPSSVAVRLTAQMPTEQAGQWQTATLNGNQWTISYTLPSEVADPTGSYTVTVRAADNVANRTADNVAIGVLRLDSSGPNAMFSALDGQRQVISDTITLSGVISDTLAGIDKLQVAFTPIDQVVQQPSFDNRPWQNATLTQRGAEVTNSTWQIQVPSGLEEQVQIDLRAFDMLGNVSQIGNVWRGLIDTQSPRLVLKANATGASYFDPAHNARRYAISYVCVAQDNYLDEARFQCTGDHLPPPVRSFDSDPVLQSLFPDWSIRSGLAISYTQWKASAQPSGQMSACDIYGHCASAQPSATVGVATAAADTAFAAGEPVAVIVNPADQSFVASAGAISVTIAGEAAQSLKEVTLKLDGVVVDRVSFAQSPATTRTQRSVSVTPTGEGKHTLVATASDWAGKTQSTLFPITFTLDKQLPMATIETTVLTADDTYQIGSGILRFHGTANDSLCLATVQLRVGNQPFVDTAYGGGEWHAAQPVNGPEGQNLPVTVRVVDCAGQLVEVSRTIPTQLSSPDAPDTQINSGPPPQSKVNTASFTFAAVAGKNEVVGFTCQLDGGPFIPCTNPWNYTNLGDGTHTFRVRTVDSLGFVDETPATQTWFIDLDASGNKFIYLPLIQR